MDIQDFTWPKNPVDNDFSLEKEASMLALYEQLGQPCSVIT